MKRAKDRWSMRCPVTALAGWIVLAAVAAAPAQPLQLSPTPQLTVSEVLVEGNKRIQTQHVMSYLRTKPGTNYDRNTVTEDIQRLYATHQFSWVDITNEPNKPTAGSTIVHVKVVELLGTVQAIVYNGANHVKESDLEQTTFIKRGAPMNPTMNMKACEYLEHYYHDKGRPFAQVTLREGNLVTDERVVFDIIEGPQVKVRHTEFEGNTFEPAAVLRTHLVTSRAFLYILGGTYQESMVVEDKKRLLEYYRSFGYQDVRIDVDLIPDEKHEYVTLVYHIHEGPRYVVANAQVVTLGNSEHFQTQFMQCVHQGNGSFYNGDQSKVDMLDMEATAGYQGHKVAVREEQFLGKQPGSMFIQYEVNDTTAEPDRVGNIYIIGNDRTRENVIRRQLRVYPGQVLSYPDIRVSERNLERLGIFESNPETGVKPTIEVLPQNDPNSPFHDLLVHVQEEPTGSLLFGVGINSDSGLTGSVVLNERNFDIMNWPGSFEDLLSGNAFRGAGQEFRAEAVPGTVAQRYSVSFREPYLFDSPYSMKIDAYYFERIYNEYTEDRLGGRLTFGRRLGENWTVSVGTRLETVNIFAIPDGAPNEITTDYGNHFLAGFNAGVTFDTRDSYLRPTSGMVATANFEEVTGSYTFPKASFEASLFHTVLKRADGSGRQVVALRSVVAWAGENTPVFERYYGGGFQSLRGFEFRGVGPDVNGFKTGGDFMFLNSIEYQVPVLANDRLYTLAFLDTGTVERSVEIKDYRVSVGFGFRISVPMLGPVPIALDFGFPLVQASFDNKQIFSFSIGWFH